MVMESDTADTATEPGVTWAQVDRGFYVGSRVGEFLGYVDERPDGVFQAFDMASAIIGEFSALAAAIHAVNTHGRAEADA